MGSATRHVGILGPPVANHPQQLKLSGIANHETVDVADNEKGITFTRKNKANASKPARNFLAQDLKKDFRKVAKTIISKTSGSNYRKDLSGPALARWCKVWKSQHRK